MMMKKKTALLGILWFAAAALAGCSGKTEGQVSQAAAEAGALASAGEEAGARLPDGTYTAKFQTDSSMFRVNEACDGTGTLTVENGEMVIHISLGSKNIVNLYPGLAEEAQEEGAKILYPTVDTITYSDGWTEEVYGFDVPVPALEEEFDLALVGTKGKWYDHKVMVSDPEPAGGLAAGEGEPDAAAGNGEAQTGPAGEAAYSAAAGLEDGRYMVEVVLEGGSGRAGVESPAALTVSQGKASAQIRWSSPYYDYMVVGGETYLPVSTEGNSVFEVPVPAFDEPVEAAADTVAMGTPHEIEYTLTFLSDTIQPEGAAGAANSPSLVYEGSMELQYAENFAVDYYEGGYTMLSTTLDGKRFLLVPEGKEAPGGLKEEIVVLGQPVEDIYLVASAVMDMFCSLDGLDAVAFSGQKEDGWYMEEAREAMAQGKLLYAGKYNQPDYEQIVAGGCSLAIENRMILHSPEVIEKLEGFGIPVLVESSSYESHPLGRVEWVKFFGALLGKEEEAERIFESQAEILKRVEAEERTDQAVAFFFVASNGLIQVRQPSDYIPKMIELAGGKYVFEGLGDPETKRSTMTMQAEEFYNGARDADFLVYNSSIDGGVSSLEELLGKCPFLADFRAVKEGNAWCTTNDMYQQSLSVGYLVEDFHTMLSGGGEEGMHYLFRLK